MLKPVRSFLITGDSWAAGEFLHNSDYNFVNIERVKKKSIATYLRRYGHTVLHKPITGGCDIDSINVISDYHKNYDYIILFKTDTVRSFRFNSELQSLNDNFSDKLNNVSNNIYNALDKFKHKLIMIGGLEKVNESFDCFYTIPSICELVDSTFVDVKYYCDIKAVPYIDAINDKRGVKNCLKEYERKLNFMAQNKHFPDSCHPGKTVHRLLAKLVNKHLKK